jgi:hypothetical protein
MVGHASNSALAPGFSHAVTSDAFSDKVALLSSGWENLPVIATYQKGVQETAYPLQRSDMFNSVLNRAVMTAVLGFTIVRKAIIIDRRDFESTIETFGRCRSTLQPGFHLILPFGKGETPAPGR